MNFKLLTSASLLLTLLLPVACGKKVNSMSQSRQTSDLVTDEESQLPIIKLLAEAATDNDFEAFRQIHFKHPRVNLNKPTQDDDTLLAIVTRKNHRQLFNYLLERKVNLEQQSWSPETFGMTPLIIASAFGHYHLVKDLLDAEVEVNRNDGRKNTALHYAIRKKQDAITILLLKYRADINLKDEQGRHAYALALDAGSVKTIDYLHAMTEVKEGMLPDAGILKSIIVQGNLETLDKVLRRHPNILKENEHLNPLALAVQIRDDNQAFLILKMLLEYQLRIDGPRDSQVIPLIEAVKMNRTLAASLLLQRKANSNLRDQSDDSALYYAISLNSYEMVDLLLSYSADTHYKYQLPRERGHKKFQACQHAYEVQARRQLESSLIVNRTILQRLGCR